MRPAGNVQKNLILLFLDFWQSRIKFVTREKPGTVILKRHMDYLW